MTDNFADDLFIGGNDEDYEFFSILQEYDEQFVDEPSGFPQADTFSYRAKTQGDTKPTDNPPKLISVKSVFTQPQDKKFIEVFEFANFNPLQSRCFDILYNKDINIVVSAPTASGKTTIFEIALCRLFRDSVAGRAIYLAPIKALCQQVATNWGRRFGRIGLRCFELTGDTDPNDVPELCTYNIVLTTPEKWDSVTRRWKDHSSFVENVSLLLIDEVHLLGSGRGATLEAVVSRMKAVRADKCRIVALSATIPNVEDIATWIGVPEEGVVCVGDEFRPVHVDVHVIGYQSAKNDYIFDRNLNYKLASIIMQYGDGRPVLIFCSSRKGAATAAQQVVKDCPETVLVNSIGRKETLLEKSFCAEDKVLAECIAHGVGFHTAAMSPNDRELVERMFLNETLLVVCTTSTLSQGVNFPAHLVIIKSTQHYIPGKGYVEIEEMDMKQMIGRAGRPQFDKTATAVIMTSKKSEFHWNTFANSSSRPIESTLISQLKEHIVAESVLGSITSTSGAILWLQSTYLWQRVQKNPGYYGLSRGLGVEKLRDELRTICLKDLRALQAAGLIELKTVDGAALAPTELGSVMARYYVLFETMCEFQKVTATSDIEHLISLISNAKEFCDVRLRVSEKRVLNELNANHFVVRYPLGGGNPAKFRVKSDPDKVNLLMQSTLGGYEFKDDFGLRQDVQNVFRCAGRLARCLRHVITIVQKLQYYTPLFSSIILSKCIERRMWNVDDVDDSGSTCATPAIFRQLSSIGPTFASGLYNDGGLRTFDDLRCADPSLIERVCGRKPPFGANLKIQVADLVPKLGMNARFVREDGGSAGCRSTFQVDVKVECGKIENSMCVLLIGNNKNKVLLYKKVIGGGGGENLFRVYGVEKNEFITVSLISESFVGVDVYEKVCNDKKVVESGFWSKKKEPEGESESKTNTEIENESEDDESESENELSFFLDYKKKNDKTKPQDKPKTLVQTKNQTRVKINPKAESKNENINESKISDPKRIITTTPIKATSKTTIPKNKSILFNNRIGDDCCDSLNQFFKKKKNESSIKKREAKISDSPLATKKATVRNIEKMPPVAVEPNDISQEPIQKMPRTEAQIQYDSMFDGLFG